MKLKDLKLVGDAILVDKDECPEYSDSGLVVIPDTVRKALEPGIGEVLATGAGVFLEKRPYKRQPHSVKAGDKVLFPRWGGLPVETEEGKYWLFRDDDMWAIIEEGDVKMIRIGGQHRQCTRVN